jgi:hypothetical protein
MIPPFDRATTADMRPLAARHLACAASAAAMHSRMPDCHEVSAP